MDGDKRSICTIAEPYGTYTPIDLTYPLITPPPLFSIHSWMVRTYPHLNCQILLNSPPTTLLQITRAASSLLLSLTFNAPPKFKLLSPPLLFPPSPFWMCIKPRPTWVRRDSLMAPLSKERRRGILERLSPSDSAIFRAVIRPISARAANLLACPPRLIKKLSIVLFPTRPHASGPWN